MSGTPRATTASERLVNAIWNKTSTVGELHESARALVNEAHTLERELTAATRERAEARAEVERLREDSEMWKQAYYGSVPYGAQMRCGKCGHLVDIEFKVAAIDAARKEAE